MSERRPYIVFPDSFPDSLEPTKDQLPISDSPPVELDAVARLQELHRLWNDLGIKAKYGYDSDKLERIEELLKPYWMPETP